jgi:general secretion pathway protein G
MKMTLAFFSAGAARRQRERGFTFIELLAVLLILGLLAAIATPQVMKYLGRARTDSARLQVQGLGGAVDLYYLDIGRYPSNQEGLKALVDRPPAQDKWNGPYVKKRDMLVDPWGRPYRYRFPGQHGDYDIYSLGADDAEGGEGDNRDVTSW